TLGGLALAVGILVDDATVELENIHRNLAMGKPMIRAILDGAMQIAVPAFVSTLSICIVFVPIFFLSGTAKYLFQPLAMAVIFAMLASYFLSRTVVPTMVKFLMGGHLEEIDTSLAQGLEENETAGDKIDNESSESPIGKVTERKVFSKRSSASSNLFTRPSTAVSTKSATVMSIFCVAVLIGAARSLL